MKLPHHSLIDPDDPNCLYCQSRCNIALEGRYLMIPSNPAQRVDTDTFTCQNCGEKFQIHSLYLPEEGDAKYTGFSFTCQGYRVLITYTEDCFVISDDQDTHIVTTPPFEVDFSDKQKLSEKLKTYIVFS